METELAELLIHPFQSDEVGFQDRTRENRMLREIHRQTNLGESTQDFSEFKKPAPQVLAPHVEFAQRIDKLFLSENASEDTARAVLPYKERLQKLLADLNKNFRVYVDTAQENTLTKEAERLERRYFEQTGDKKHIEFIMLKRYYEKLRTFNEAVKLQWREIFALLDTLSVMIDNHTASSLKQKEITFKIRDIARTTDEFLDALKSYLKVEQEEQDSMTGTCRITLYFTSTITYTLSAFIGGKDEKSKDTDEQTKEDTTPLFTKKPEEGSIARNIVLETKERRLNKTRIFSVPILGSRDWNRTPHYALEITTQDYEANLETFNSSYFVVLEEGASPRTMSITAAMMMHGSGAASLTKYVAILVKTLNLLSDEITKIDYPGLENPSVFLYHCGAKVLYQILLLTLRQQGIGKILYLDAMNTPVREFPSGVIKKTLIDWWTLYFAALSGEEVDSYVLFARLQEMIKKDYRILCDEGEQLYKREMSKNAYPKIDGWLRDNRFRIFGLRKSEIFRRFIPESIPAKVAVL